MATAILQLPDSTPLPALCAALRPLGLVPRTDRAGRLVFAPGRPGESSLAVERDAIDNLRASLAASRATIERALSIAARRENRHA